MRIDGTGAAETVVMLRTKLSLSRILPKGLAACCSLMVTSSALAAPPQAPGALEPDYAASGFVVPAGYSEIKDANPTGVVQAGAPYGQVPQYQVAPVGYFGGMMAGGCDTGYGCDQPYGCDGCAVGCGSPVTGGLIGNRLCRMNCGCESCAGLSGLRHICLFCGGDGCGVCQSLGNAQLAGLLGALAPYTEAGLGAQRWYDVSVEFMAMRQNQDAAVLPITSQGTLPLGNIVLTTAAVDDDSLAPGARISFAMICGVGGNLEATYMGFDEFGGRATVNTVAPGLLFSAFSNFGQAPPGGYNDTDQSLSQSIASESRLNSFEVNYRRRWVGPYSRFQGSWLAGFRYIDYDDIFRYSTQGNVPGNFFNGAFDASNSLTGFQFGGDLWWNLYPGINLGVGYTAGILGNDARNTLNANFNSAAQQLFDTAQDTETVWMNEITATLVYRISYSWSIRSSYHFLDLNNIALGTSSLPTVVENYRNQIIAGTVGTGANLLGPVNAGNDVNFSGFTIGAEYLW